VRRKFMIGALFFAVCLFWRHDFGQLMSNSIVVAE